MTSWVEDDYFSKNGGDRPPLPPAETMKSLVAKELTFLGFELDPWYMEQQLVARTGWWHMGIGLTSSLELTADTRPLVSIYI